MSLYERYMADILQEQRDRAERTRRIRDSFDGYFTARVMRLMAARDFWAPELAMWRDE